MRLTTIGLLAALIPATAAAGPNPNQQQDRQTKNDRQSNVEVDQYEWSSGQEGHLGVMVMGLNKDLRAYFGAPRDTGLLVAHVAPGSPAARAGLRVGDVITRFGNERVDSAADILSGIAKMESPQTVAIELVRDHKQMTVQAALGARSDTSSRDSI